jgi:hypothetical protein
MKPDMEAIVHMVTVVVSTGEQRSSASRARSTAGYWKNGPTLQSVFTMCNVNMGIQI